MGVEGLLILGVEPQSPADRAGLKATEQTPNGEIIPGDVIQALDGKKILTADQLFAVLERRSPGEEITLQVWRDGKTREVKLKLDPPR